MGKMRDCKAGGDTPVLMEDDEVRYPCSEGGGGKLREHGISSIQPNTQRQ